MPERPELKLEVVSSVSRYHLLDHSVLVEKDVKVIAGDVYTRKDENGAVFQHISIVVKDLLMIDFLDAVWSA